MPPKNAPGTVSQQHTRKPTAISNLADHKGKTKEKDMEPEKTTTTKKINDSEIMPPPPPPPSKPDILLEPELGALEESLKTITITTAQIFRFYADAKRLGLQTRAPRPPRSMTHDLERELGRYDQICDTIDAHLTRAIAILQRDLTREENRIREEEAEKARAKAKAALETNAGVELSNAPEPSSEATEKQRQSTPFGPISGTGKVPLRRPSKISLSTLHRNPFPMKLDLSSASLRLGSDEGLNISALDNLNDLSALGSMGVDSISGLASPVTLAPKSARPMAPGELPPEVLAALASASGVGSQNMQLPDPSQHVDIDLTIEDDLAIPANMRLLNSGNSADKPIELDFDVQMSDIFGEQRADGAQQSGAPTDADMEKLFGPEAGGVSSATDAGNATSGMDMNLLLSSENHGNDDAIFASLNPKNDRSGEVILNSQGTGDGANGGNGDNVGFDYSLFFNENQQHIDMMQFLAMNNTGTAAETQGTAGGSPSVAPGIT